MSQALVDQLGPASDLVAITPHATNAIRPPRWLSVTGDGNVTLRAVTSSEDVVVAMVAGTLYPVQAQYIRATGTTATGIIGWY